MAGPLVICDHVDPGFADLLAGAADAGFWVSAFATRFDPSDVRLHDADVPVEFV